MKKQKKYSNVDVAKLADAFGKSMQTIKRWVKKNDDRLTSLKAVNALKKQA